MAAPKTVTDELELAVKLLDQSAEHQDDPATARAFVGEAKAVIKRALRRIPLARCGAVAQLDRL